MKNSIYTSVIILLVFLFPFRLSFMSPEVTGISSILNFGLVLIGILAFLFLTIGRDENPTT
ncbi:MAG: hypothetical protein ACR2GN_08995 [Bacteroidia bacterium]